MSKPAQRKKNKGKQTHPPEIKPLNQHKKNSLLILVVIAILAAIPFSLGKYFEFNSPDAFDSGAYVYSAKHILEGAEIGVDEKPSARLGTLLVNILGVSIFGFNEIGPELIQMLLQAAAMLMMFIAARKLFGTLPAAISVIITSIYLSSPLIAKFGNVKEQHMIAFMILGISFFVIAQLNQKPWPMILAGAFISWAPLFKETGTSAIGAIALFIIAQPIFKNKTWKQTSRDILLLLAGFALAIGPLYIWIIGWNIKLSLPYSFAWKTIASLLPAAKAADPSAADAAKVGGSYISGARKLIPFSRQWPIVLRYYKMLILPITLAAVALITRLTRLTMQKLKSSKISTQKNYEPFVLIFATWWLLDMAFVWISPRSYEQYYLPLNASAAMLAGYPIALYADKTKAAIYKTKWRLIGLVGLTAMIAMSWHIFFGIQTSPHSGSKYRNQTTGELEKRKGYTQNFEEISQIRKNNWKGQWEVLAEYVKNYSTPDDKIYVWGWYPGIYVEAQRFSSASKAFMMPRSKSPQNFKIAVAQIIAEFENEKPKFIIDSRKRHVPMERPPYELWPIVLKGFMGEKTSRFLTLNKNDIANYDKNWSQYLRTQFDEEEAARYQALKPFRDFIMKNYKIEKMFGQHVLFKLKTTKK